MSLSRDLYHLQTLDSSLDTAQARIKEIDLLLSDTSKEQKAKKFLAEQDAAYQEKLKSLKAAETAVGDHQHKIDQNQNRLYGGAITNPKELEDLQLESESLQKYLLVLEERQLEAMLEMEDALAERNKAADSLEAIETELEALHANLTQEKSVLQNEITTTNQEKEKFLKDNQLSELNTYQKIRSASGGIAVTLMISDSCSACGANIPSAIAQEARSPGILAFCPTCKRILHPG